MHQTKIHRVEGTGMEYFGFCGYGDSHRFFCGYGMGMGIKIHSPPRQPTGLTRNIRWL